MKFKVQCPQIQLVAQLVKNPPAMQETLVQRPWAGRSSGEEIGYPLQYSWAPLVAQLVKNPPAMWETWVQSLGREEWQPTPLLLPRKFHGWRSLVGHSPWGHKELDTTEWLHYNEVWATRKVNYIDLQMQDIWTPLMHYWVKEVRKMHRWFHLSKMEE